MPPVWWAKRAKVVLELSRVCEFGIRMARLLSGLECRVSPCFRKLCLALARVLAMITAFANVTGRQFMVAPGYSHE